MNILVTGGAGYIGSHICKELSRQGHKVVVFDDLSTGWRELAQWGELVEGDIRDTDKLRKVLRAGAIEGVIHCAAKSCVGESVANPGLYYACNVGGSVSLLEAMQDTGVNRIIMSGTCAVYGQSDSVPIAESAPIRPMNPYGASKMFMERVLQDFAHAHDLRWVSLRYFNAAGCDPEGETGEKHVPETHLIPRVLLAATGNIDALEIFDNNYDTPDGTCIRDYVHVSDLASAHVLALTYLTEGGASRALNLGTGTGFSVREILATAGRVLGRTVPVVMRPRREGDAARLVADARLAGEVLHWRPGNSSLEHIIATAWSWHQKRLS